MKIHFIRSIHEMEYTNVILICACSINQSNDYQNEFWQILGQFSKNMGQIYRLPRGWIMLIPWCLVLTNDFTYSVKCLHIVLDSVALVVTVWINGLYNEIDIKKRKDLVIFGGSLPVQKTQGHTKFDPTNKHSDRVLLFSNDVMFHHYQ